MWKRYVQPSTTEARTQPLVLSPATRIVSMPRSTRWPIRGVPQNALGEALRMTSSPGLGATSSMISYFWALRASASGSPVDSGEERIPRAQVVITDSSKPVV